MPILMPTTFCPKEDGDYLLLGQDHGENLKEIARHSHARRRRLRRLQPRRQPGPPGDQAAPRPRSRPTSSATTPRSSSRWPRSASRFRKLDKKVLHDAVRLLTGSAADFLDDYFESDILKGYLASSAIIGTKVGPYSQGSGLVLLYHILGEHDGEMGAWSFHKRGNGGFTQVLARAAQSFGVEIRLESPVDRVITKNGRATGVALTDGTEFHAPVVVSRARPAPDVPRARRAARAADRPRRDHPAVPLPGHLGQGQLRARRRCRSYPALGDRTDQYRGFTNIGPSMEYLERAYDDAKYGWYSKRPYLDTAIQSMVDPDMAPPGKAVMSCFVQYAPYHLRESDWDTEKENLGDTVQATLESFFPGFGDLVLQREVRTPLDIERTVGLSEGNIFAGEFLAPQMFFFRPAPGWSQYRTPIDGYYQCGSGHPSGRLRDGRAGQARRRPDPQGPRAGRRRGLRPGRHPAHDLARAPAAQVLPRRLRSGRGGSGSRARGGGRRPSARVARARPARSSRADRVAASRPLTSATAWASAMSSTGQTSGRPRTMSR